MTITKIISTLLFTLALKTSLGQDTTWYKQVDAFMYSNNYIFIKNNKTDNFGTFIRTSGTDDFQEWYGVGKFTETKKKIILTYDTANYHNSLEYKFNPDHEDTLFIKWVNWYREQQNWFTVITSDSLGTEIIYSKPYKIDFLKVPFSALTGQVFYLRPFGSDRKLIRFEIKTKFNELIITANDPQTMHTFSVKETLKKNKDGFITVGMWTSGKKVQFVKGL